MGRWYAGFDRNIVNAGDAAERFPDDPALPEKLGVGGNLLPLAAAAPISMGTEGLDTVWGGLLNPLDTAPGKRVFLPGDTDQDPIAGNAAGDEHDPFADMTHGIAAVGKRFEYYRNIFDRRGFGFHWDHTYDGTG
jgi:hypothetical protein